MRRLTIALVCSLFSLIVLAATPDTIAVQQTDITKWIVEQTTTSKGKPTTKYYCIYKGELVNTSKTVSERASLCKKHNAKCALILITSKSGRKRIALN